jgi:hypothetical protein
MWAARQRPTAALAGRIGLSLVVAAHLVLAAVLPGGRNALLGLKAGSVLSYLTMIPVGDSLGFYKTRGQDGFVVYKIYTQDGNVVEGAFPDQRVSPRIRYDRWAVFTHHASADNGDFHAAFIKYLVRRLPTAPLKVELLSAKWDWTRNSGPSQLREENHGGLLVLRKLGTYDGLRKKWTPSKTPRKK